MLACELCFVKSTFCFNTAGVEYRKEITNGAVCGKQCKSEMESHLLKEAD